MVNKKYLLLAGFMSAMAATPVLAQESGTQAGSKYGNRDMTYRGENYDQLDTVYIPKSRMPQQRKFLNHQTFFPAKPRSMWELGLNVGMINVLGDVPSNSPFTAKKFTDATGFGLSVRKAIGYAFSLRLAYMHGVASGIEYRPSNPNEQPWSGLYNPTNSSQTLDKQVYHNYRTVINALDIQLVAATNNIRFHKAKNTFSLYMFLGFGGMGYTPKVDALGADGKPYTDLFAAVYAKGNVNYKDRKDVYKELRDGVGGVKGLDGDYETPARKNSQSGKGATNTAPMGTLGLGGQFKLGPRFAINLEEKIGVSGKDGLDAVEIQNFGGLSPDKDMLMYTSIGLNYNIGNKAKNVQPLWWINPLDYVYQEVSDPRHQHQPEPTLMDTDGDGVLDQLDKCPGTPAGIAVDAHGCPMDSDGDGVPDDRDKELITPTECQPVDADGVGKCPCHCPPPDHFGGECSNIYAGTITFSGTSISITAAMEAQLAALAAQLNAAPNCKIVLTGQGNKNKPMMQRSWDRVNALQTYMTDKHGIARDRMIFRYGEPGDPNSVMYRSANPDEVGLPTSVAPPAPQLSGKH